MFQYVSVACSVVCFQFLVDCISQDKELFTRASQQLLSLSITAYLVMSAAWNVQAPVDDCHAHPAVKSWKTHMLPVYILTCELQKTLKKRRKSSGKSPSSCLEGFFTHTSSPLRDIKVWKTACIEAAGTIHDPKQVNRISAYFLRLGKSHFRIPRSSKSNFWLREAYTVCFLIVWFWDICMCVDRLA